MDQEVKVREAREVFVALSAVVTRLQTGETMPRTVISERDGHALIGIENCARPAGSNAQRAQTAGTTALAECAPQGCDE